MKGDAELDENQIQRRVKGIFDATKEQVISKELWKQKYIKTDSRCCLYLHHSFHSFIFFLITNRTNIVFFIGSLENCKLIFIFDGNFLTFQLERLETNFGADISCLIRVNGKTWNLSSANMVDFMSRHPSVVAALDLGGDITVYGEFLSFFCRMFEILMNGCSGSLNSLYRDYIFFIFRSEKQDAHPWRQ